MYHRPLFDVVDVVDDIVAVVNVVGIVLYCDGAPQRKRILDP
jgi:hypothetical protein